MNKGDIIMSRARQPIVDIEKFLRLRELMDDGVLSLDECTRCLGITKYMWNKLSTKYKNFNADEISEYQYWELKKKMEQSKASDD